MEGQPQRLLRLVACVQPRPDPLVVGVEFGHRRRAAVRSMPMSSALVRCSATKASRSAAENGSLLRRAMSAQEETSPQCTHSSNSGRSPGNGCRRDRVPVSETWILRTRRPARSASAVVPNVRVSMNVLVRLNLAQASAGAAMVAAFCSVPRITRGCSACRYSARRTTTHMIRLVMTRQVTDSGPNKPSSSRAGSSGLVYGRAWRPSSPPSLTRGTTKHLTAYQAPRTSEWRGVSGPRRSIRPASGRHEQRARAPRQAVYNELITGTRAASGQPRCWKMIVHTRMYAHT